MTVGDDAPPAPTSATCADAPQLRQRAIDDRRRSDELKSDRGKIVLGNRANFLASLANIAELKCRTTATRADEVLRTAFEAARAAESTTSEYQRAIKWGEADFIAAEAIALLITQLPAPPSK